VELQAASATHKLQTSVAGTNIRFIGCDSMQALAGEQSERIVGVDVGGTFTDLVSVDRGVIRITKVPSTPPEFDRGVINALTASLRNSDSKSNARLIHGSTVATNALLQRRGEPIAFVTTDGFRDMMLIGRQNRPRLYALHVERPKPITPEENWFTVRERIDARGEVVIALEDDEIEKLSKQIRARGLGHVAICLLFSFVNPLHERRLGEKLIGAGLTVSLSSEILPEFREYERASTTAINASLRPTVQKYLESLRKDLPNEIAELRIVQSGGGTLDVADASRLAARLVLSGPAGGVMGAAFIARAAGYSEIITYDMGGTSTDVATVIEGKPNWTTASVLDGLPIGLPMFDIQTVGAGGGSVAYRDTGGALRVGPRSAGAVPGPACYGRGGMEPTVTDANLILGRILPDWFLGGEMKIDPDLAHRAIEPLAADLGKSVIETAIGIITIAEANMSRAIRAVTAQRGHDPRKFTLISFGGAGGLHACALAEALDIPRVVVPPYAGVLSALGMVVAPPIVDVSRTVVHLGATVSDHDLEAQFARLTAQAAELVADHDTVATEYFADVRFRGQSHELKVALNEFTIADISRRFYAAYREIYGRPPKGRAIEVVTLRVRRTGRAAEVALPTLQATTLSGNVARETAAFNERGQPVRAAVLQRSELMQMSVTPGPIVLTDPEATTFVPQHWTARCDERGIVQLTRR